jgi:hypothetical protein
MDSDSKKPKFILIKDKDFKKNKNIYRKVDNQTRIKLLEMVINS